MPADQCEGRPPARARLLSSPVRPPVQMHCKHSQIARMPQAGREPLLQFLCVLPPVYTARLAAESGLRLVCACTTTRDRRCLCCEADAFRYEKRDPPAKRPCRGSAQAARHANKPTDKSTTANKQQHVHVEKYQLANALPPNKKARYSSSTMVPGPRRA